MKVMVIVKANKDTEAGIMPTTEELAAMGNYNEELVKAGIMLAGDGLQPSAKGKRIKFSGGKRTVVDGPFTETKELIAGYWIWQVRSMDEAVEWARRVEQLGAGEIVLTSMDADGTQDGYDLEITRAVADAVKIPVVASGGAGSPHHLYEAVTKGHASAALAASIFHYGKYTIQETKRYMAERGVVVRL